MDGASAELPKYRCHKEVWALKIAEINPGREDGQGPGATIVPVEAGYAPISVSDAWESKHQPKVGGYLVFYADGYKSFSPAKAFEDGYTPI